MASHKMQKFCRIMVWLEQTDSDLAATFKDLCMAGHLTGFAAGVTFLYPEKSVRKAIQETARGEEPEKACDMLLAHIIPMHLGTAAAFKSEKVGSKKGVLIKVKSASGSTVELESGAKLAPMASFKPMRDNIAVWEVKSGEVPLEGEPFDARAARKRGGDAEPAGNQLRQQLAWECMKEFKGSMAQGGKAARVDTAFLSRVVSFLKFLKDNAGTFADDLDRAMSVLDYNPVAYFFILFEPFKTQSADFFISDAAVSAWAQGLGTKVFMLEPSKALAQALSADLPLARASAAGVDAGGNPTVPRVYADPSGVAAQVRAFADEFGGQVGVGLQIARAYEQTLSANRVGALDAVFSQQVQAALQNGRKLWQDLLRFCLRIVQYRLLNRDARAESEFAAIYNCFVTLVQSTLPGNDYSKEVSEMCSAAAAGNCLASNIENASFCFEFARSHDFFYTPQPARVLGEFKGPSGNPDENPRARPPWHGPLMSLQALNGRQAQEAQEAEAQRRALGLA